MTPQCWITQFGAAYAVPDEITKHPRLIDQSWGNDACPCFMVQGCGCEITLWVDHPDQCSRELGDAERFIVIQNKIDPSDADCYAADHETRLIVATNDAAEAIASAMHAADTILFNKGNR